MGKDKLKASPPSPLLGGEGGGMLVAEEGASLLSGSMRLYYLLPSHPRRGAGGEAIGCVDLYNYDPVNKRAAVGIMVATEYRRQGYALAMLQKLEELFSVQCATQDSGSQLNTEHSTLNTGIHCLYADIAAANTASLALFKKAGYVQCGHFKEWLEYDSHFIDNIRMQKIL